MLLLTACGPVGDGDDSGTAGSGSAVRDGQTMTVALADDPGHARPDAGPDPGRADGVHAPLLAPTSPSAVAVCRPVPPSYREFAAEPAPASAEESTTSSRMDVLTMKLRHSFSQNQCGPGLGCLDDPAPDQRWPAPRPGTSGSYQLTAARISPQCCSNSRCPSLGYSTSLELGNTAEK